MSVMTAPPIAPDVEPSDEERVGAARLLPATWRGWALSMAALLYFAGSIGYMIGIRTESPPGRDSVDIGFLQDMITHHEQAVEMSNIELASGAEPGVQAFAREILSFQAYEIGVMEGKLAAWGDHPENRSETAMAWMGTALPVDRMPGLASEEEMRALGQAEGRAVDALFVRLMQDHHRGGVHMADFAAEDATDRSVRELAARMARNQRIEIGELDAALQRTALDPTPDGYVPSEMPAEMPADQPADHNGHG